MTIQSGELILLDTTVFVHVAREDATGQAILQQYGLKERAERPLFSTVSEGEALALSRMWGWGHVKIDRLRLLFKELVRIDAGLPEVIDAYAELHATSRQLGLGIGENDMWIASSAKAAGAVVLTCDTDIRRVPEAFVRVEFVAQIR